LFQQIIPQTFKTTAMSTIEKKSLSVGKYVNTEHVDTAIRNYKQERWVQNSERLGKADSMSVWYSAEELQGFIDTIREHGGDGVRMYFGAYGEKAPKAGFEGRQTVVLVATRSKEVNEKVNHKDLYITQEGKSNILAYNMGQLCPPFCPPPAGGIGGSVSLGVTLVESKDGLSVI
jgi:hypothetical protein